MTIQVGHPHECPTFFCPPPMRKSTGQQVNGSTSLQVGESTGWCPIGRISPIRPMPPKEKAPLRQNLRQSRHISIIISVRYNFTDRKNRPFGLQYQLDIITQTERTVPLVCRLLPQPKLRLTARWLSSAVCRSSTMPLASRPTRCSRQG